MKDEGGLLRRPIDGARIIGLGRQVDRAADGIQGVSLRGLSDWAVKVNRAADGIRCVRHYLGSRIS